MEIEQSSLYREVQEVLSSPAKPVHYRWKAELHVDDATFEALKVISIDDLREFDDKFSEEVMLEIAIGMGTYAYDLYPNNTNLEVTLTRYPLTESGAFEGDGGTPQVERYAATLVDKGNLALEGNGGNTASRDTLNLTNIITIELQLQRKAVEQLRLVTIGIKMRDSTVEDAIKSILTRESLRLNVDSLQMPKGVDMVEASNTTKRDHIIVPDDVRLVDVPQFIHDQCGVYSAGMGYFLQGDYWHVYPCYDTKRFGQAKHTMTLVNVPRNKLPFAERTYSLDGDHLTVLATGEVKFKDDSNVLQLNEGNGVRFTDANQLANNTFVQVQGNKATAARARNTSEFVVNERPSGFNSVRQSSNAITANPYAEYSKMARRNGSFLQFVWENAQPSLLMPGMMAKILYLDGEEVKEVIGSLLKVHTQHKLEGEGMTASRYRTISVLVFFTDRPAK